MSAYTQADLHQYLLKYFIKHPAVFGGVDILNLHFATPQARVAIYLDILSRIRHDDGRIAVEAFVVVVPYGNGVAEYANTPSLLSADPRHVSDKPFFKLADDPRFRGRLHLVPATDCRHEGVLSLLRSQSVRTAAIVAEAAIYRNDSVSPFMVSSLSPRLEDFWVPQLHALATESVNIAKCNEMYVVLDTGRFSPTRTALADLLLTIDNCGVLGSDNEQGLDYILASRSDRWENWLQDGRLGRAMRDIDELPSTSCRNRLLLRTQLFHRVDLYRHILSDVRELTESISRSATSVITVQFLCHCFDSSAVASDLSSIWPSAC